SLLRSRSHHRTNVSALYSSARPEPQSPRGGAVTERYLSDDAVILPPSANIADRACFEHVWVQTRRGPDSGPRCRPMTRTTPSVAFSFSSLAAACTGNIGDSENLNLRMTVLQPPHARGGVVSAGFGGSED